MSRDDEITFSMKRISSQCGVDLGEMKVAHDSLYGDQLLIGDTRTAGMKSFKGKEFESYLSGFADACTMNNNELLYKK